MEKTMKLWVIYLTTPYGKATEIFGVFDSKDKAERARANASSRGHGGARIVERLLNSETLR
ncbi:hypothetical protein NTE_02322 [Candidatus Nitrososphaera evergladensis SR1]|jgi:hypothetical protein|uniref:Uncharacterized protein n=1 Tax=Candidatus Nitrososphaera evergladensis SR1 TaxID=1459636 RepID=A0A075MT36_9ARCH|nr:hypothetical protein [Candidatus Nitrososphaera evergladensis]AIF84375.1 hypothetical protein NTE_02322 [Candidatus Nitrososphaera evergladensis SR1]